VDKVMETLDSDGAPAGPHCREGIRHRPTAAQATLDAAARRDGSS